MSFKILFISTILLVFSFSRLYSQLPSGKYADKKEAKEKTLSAEDRIGIDFFVGYNRSSFLNSVYFNNLKNKAYINSGGISYGGRINFHPIFFDVFFRKTSYSKHEISGLDPNEKISQRGFDFSLSYVFLPYLGSIGRNVHLSPYAGIGYQYSQLCYYCNRKEGDSDDLTVPMYATNTSTPFFKFGIATFIKKLRFDIDYRRSWSLENKVAFNGISISVGAGMGPK